MTATREYLKIDRPQRHHGTGSPCQVVYSCTHYSGIFPCCFFGLLSRLVRSNRRPSISLGLVSRGSMTSSRKRRAAARYGLANVGGPRDAVYGPSGPAIDKVYSKAQRVAWKPPRLPASRCGGWREADAVAVVFTLRRMLPDFRAENCSMRTSELGTLDPITAGRLLVPIVNLNPSGYPCPDSWLAASRSSWFQQRPS